MNPLDLISGERVVELTKTLVEIPSETGKEQRIADWMINHFTELGLSDITRLPVKEAGDTVTAVLKGGSGPKMMLNFHIDTFDAFEGWETEPFKAVEKDGRLYGLGAHDMKAGVA
ncbi:M20/M25/M40 family metallo-hydrolase, partial [Candidatus Bathyarchaeota archaeon]|nr:M20/M25/M40 family metallo-hydrolase [Candidatus Bathyarchaeota archaeon]